MAAIPETSSYPVRFDIDYQEQLDRLTSALRIIWIIPIAIVAALLSPGQEAFLAAAGGAGLLFLPVVLMLVFRQKYPQWWWDWNLQLVRFEARVGAYLFLLTDRYPATDDEQNIHLDFVPPDATQLNRWLPLVKWFLAIPHYIVLLFLAIAVVVVTIIAWFAILFTGKYPEGLFRFVVGVGRWGYRVQAYAFLLTTDRYPPFGLN